MPYDSNGNYTLPDTYFVENGDTVLPIQHNPPLEDIQSALSSVLLRSGVAPMTGDLKMGTKKITGMADGAATTDAVTKGQLDLQSVRYVTKAANYTLVASDNDAVVRFTATATAGLTAAATLGSNWHSTIVADGGDVTIDPDASETIAGSTTLKVPNGSSVFVICSGTAFFAIWLQQPKWQSRAIGELYYANTALTGVEIPPSSTFDTVWIELTSGLTGVGGFNNGKLRTETVSGSAPLVSAFATIDVGTSPMYNTVVRLLNSEGRIIRPSTSPGTLQNDAFQDHAHAIVGSDGSGGGVAIINNGGGGFAPNNKTGVATVPATGGTPRIADETRMKNIGVKTYMRIA